MGKGPYSYVIEKIEKGTPSSAEQITGVPFIDCPFVPKNRDVSPYTFEITKISRRDAFHLSDASRQWYTAAACSSKSLLSIPLPGMEPEV
ncbi:MULTISPECIES: hypothetical protein [unclassified Paenibacillus]|uniref:hypothetical protein n=1 Tax=unclassified Paenibacillus TaxID=185978 RepID=UPI001EF651E7|nr:MULTISPECIES: hypothetical protein [unclassified Paenibacillus]